VVLTHIAGGIVPVPVLVVAAPLPLDAPVLDELQLVALPPVGPPDVPAPVPPDGAFP